jgi:hypothetical protein
LDGLEVRRQPDVGRGIALGHGDALLTDREGLIKISHLA